MNELSPKMAVHFASAAYDIKDVDLLGGYTSDALDFLSTGFVLFYAP